jgi:hypothetical protein
MKTSHTLLVLLCAGALSSCSSVSHSPVHTMPVTTSSVHHPVRAPSAPKSDGALRQVSSTPAAPKPKAFPDIPLKEDTGTSPLIHTKTDTPTYKRSTP